MKHRKWLARNHSAHRYLRYLLSISLPQLRRQAHFASRRKAALQTCLACFFANPFPFPPQAAFTNHSPLGRAAARSKRSSMVPDVHAPSSSGLCPSKLPWARFTRPLSSVIQRTPAGVPALNHFVALHFPGLAPFIHSLPT